jgi:solute carrier family 25 (mitochondrial carnitine/acylcarnitine transporter), member 20/29
MNDFTTGFIAGAAGTIVGHPFDSVKVYSQLYQYNSNWKSCKSIADKFGPIGFFNGVTSSLFSRALTKGVIFSTYERALRLKPLSNFDYYQRLAAAGIISGVSCALISAPIEYVKIQNQLGFRFYKQIQQTGLSKINFGLKQTLLRDCPYYGIYFPLYDYLKKNNVPMAGGFVGCISWAAVYPFDSLKSREQSKNSIKLVSKYRGLYKGLLPTMIRAFPVHYTTLIVYDKLKEWTK